MTSKEDAHVEATPMDALTVGMVVNLAVLAVAVAIIAALSRHGDR